MRMRKKSWAEPFLEENKELVLQNPSQYKGRWKSLLNREEIHVEIGMGKGDYIIQMAQLNPNIAWIGIEKERNVAAVAIKKALEFDCSNQKFIALNADDFSTWFDNGEIDVIHLNFSDPWPKSGYKKRRLSHQRYLNMYKECLTENGCIIMKTDNKTLFEFSLCEFSKCGWLLKEVYVDFRSEEHSEDAISEYEAYFMSLNQPIYRAIWQKKTDVI